MKKYYALLAIVLSLILFVGCSPGTAEQVARDIDNAIDAVRDKDNAYVVAVQNSYLVGYSTDITVGEAFNGFFSNPVWRHFEAVETGENVVEFTGGLMYRDAPVTARLQFVIAEDDSTFSVGALAFNEVPQIQLITTAVLTTAFDHAIGNAEAGKWDGENESQTITPAPAPTQSNYAGSSSYADNMGVDPVIINEIYYKDIPITRLLIRPFETIMGNPIDIRGPYYFYEGMEIVSENGLINQIMATDLTLFTANGGVPVRNNWNEMLAIFGHPLEYHYDEETSYYVMLYEVYTDEIYFTVEFTFDNPDNAARIMVIRPL